MAHLTTRLMTDAAVKRVARPLLAKRFKKYGLKDLFVSEEEDFDGENILRMIAQVEKPVPTDELVSAIGDVRTALLEKGEERFVFMRARVGKDEIEEDVGP